MSMEFGSANISLKTPLTRIYRLKMPVSMEFGPAGENDGTAFTMPPSG